MRKKSIQQPLRLGRFMVESWPVEIRSVPPDKKGRMRRRLHGLAGSSANEPAATNPGLGRRHRLGWAVIHHRLNLARSVANQGGAR